ncbi:MAG: flagellar hook-associated protein FlgK [Alphaproteobacteria bacterium]|nr:flagellar hook-associated protein FlgK [Alphaproteobacteria bacterium]
MSFNGIAASALTALKTNSTALGVVSNNVANINTPGYARRVVNEQTLAAGGQLMGVDIATVQRVVDKFLQQESLSAGGGAAQYDIQAGFFSQLNGVLGAPGDNQSLATGLSNLQAALATASQAPSAPSSAAAILNTLKGLSNDIGNISSNITGLQTQIDGQVVSSVAETNALIKQVFDLNLQVKNAAAAGNTDSGLSDQRDLALSNLAQKLAIKIATASDGSLQVSTADGINLVSNTYAQLSYSGGAQNGVYGNIQIQDINPNNGQPLGQSFALDPHLSGGALKGMIDMRDQELGGLSQALGNFAQSTAKAFNAQANANAAFPPPTSLTGRNTGLLSTDALNFSGKTTLAVTGSDGTLIKRIDINFGAGTLSVNGGASASLGGTIASFTTALNTALGADGTAAFSNGALSLTSTTSNGLLVQDDAATPALRGGAGFAQFFGLNDVFKAQAPSLTATGLSASDASGLAVGEQIALSLKGPGGDIVRNVTVTAGAGMTIGNVVAALNTALGGAATFTLNSDGSISTAKSALYADYQLNVTNDSTQRGATGVSFTTLFGLGDNNQANQAVNFGVTPAIATAPQRLGMATAQLAGATLGQVVVTGGDNSGALALQGVITSNRSFGAAGGLAAQTGSLADYAATFYQGLSTRSNQVTQAQQTQDDRLQEAQTRQSANSGVSLDEELTNLTTYQQAYAAGARLLSVVGQLYDTLLQIQ